MALLGQVCLRKVIVLLVCGIEKVLAIYKEERTGLGDTSL